MLQYLSDATSAALEKALQGQALRQRTTADNIANVDTPGYRPRQVSFEQQLQAALGQTDDDEGTVIANMSDIEPGITTSAGPALRRDGNAVDIEAEMVRLAESSLHYHALIKLLSHKLQMLRTVATEGGK